MYNLILVGLGGFMGSVARYMIYVLIRMYLNNPFPLATLIVNTVGCFVIGALFALAEKLPSTMNPKMMLLFSTGLVGGFTTFSAFGLETVELLRQQQIVLALFNIFGNLAMGMMAVLGGRLLITSLFY